MNSKRWAALKSASVKKIKAGLGGWLIIVGAVLIIDALLIIFNVIELINLLPKIFGYNSLFIAMLIEFIMDFILLIANLYLIYLYFNKNRNFPKYFILFLYVSIAWAVLNYFNFSFISVNSSELQKVLRGAQNDFLRNIPQTVLSSMIWILYMHNSKRVKATFIKKQLR